MTTAITNLALLAGLALPSHAPGALPGELTWQVTAGRQRTVVSVYMQEVRCVTTVRQGRARRVCQITRRVQVPQTPGAWTRAPVLARAPSSSRGTTPPMPTPDDLDDEGFHGEPSDLDQDGDADPDELIPEAPPPAPSPALLNPPTALPPVAQPGPSLPSIPAPDATGSAMTTLESAILALLNAERTRRGLGTLTVDPNAVKAARAHNRDMCERGYFSHVSPEGTRPWDRLRKAGARFTASGENIAAGQRSATSVHQSWMDSPGHRENRMNGRYTRAGVGVHDCGGRLLFTELFLR